jgi:hypothetical protein
MIVSQREESRRISIVLRDWASLRALLNIQYQLSTFCCHFHSFLKKNPYKWYQSQSFLPIASAFSLSFPAQFFFSHG